MSGIVLLIGPSSIMELLISIILGIFVYFSVMVLIGGINNYELNFIKKLSRNTIAMFV